MILYTVNNYNIHVFTVNRIKTLIGYYMQAIETIQELCYNTKHTNFPWIQRHIHYKCASQSLLLFRSEFYYPKISGIQMCII